MQNAHDLPNEKHLLRKPARCSEQYVAATSAITGKEAPRTTQTYLGHYATCRANDHSRSGSLQSLRQVLVVTTFAITEAGQVLLTIWARHPVCEVLSIIRELQREANTAT